MFAFFLQLLFVLHVHFKPLGRLGNMRDDSAEIVFQCFLQEALVGSSGLGQGSPLFNAVHPAFPLPTTASPILQGALKDGFREAVVACDMPQTMQVSVFRQLLEEVPVDPQGS